MNAPTYRDHLDMETEGELSPAQWRQFAYVEPVALEYRAGVEVPPVGSPASRSDTAQPHVARARREACVASHLGDTGSLDDLARAGLPGIELLRDEARAQEQVPSLSRRQAD